jgi:hypothetical protein
MRRFYADHYAPGRSPVLNSIVQAGIVAKLCGSLARAALRRARRILIAGRRRDRRAPGR